jgi:hypothetical protein
MVNEMGGLRVVMIGMVLVAADSVRLNGRQMLPAPSPPWASQMPSAPQTPNNTQRTEQQDNLRISARQKRLLADTDKLLSLCSDLKAQVDKSTPGTLSVDMIKRTDEIEKLAHGMKERMKK